METRNFLLADGILWIRWMSNTNSTGEQDPSRPRRDPRGAVLRGRCLPRYPLADRRETLRPGTLSRPFRRDGDAVSRRAAQRVGHTPARPPARPHTVRRDGRASRRAAQWRVRRRMSTELHVVLTRWRWGEARPLVEAEACMRRRLTKSGDRELPLHLALAAPSTNAPPDDVVLKLLTAFPAASSCADCNGNLPLHLALRCRSRCRF